MTSIHVREETMRAHEKGFALILAILALMLLTFLGLTLLTTTTAELQIATNYRWAQQALFNAESGVEAGRAMLRGLNWEQLVPVARAGGWDGSTLPGADPTSVAPPPQSRPDAWGNPTRNFENWSCDAKGNGMGYGVVLDDGGPAGPVQFRSALLGQTLAGAVTLWVRRPVDYIRDPGSGNLTGQLRDYEEDPATLILTAEGTAPYFGEAITGRLGSANRATQVIEVVVHREPREASGCGGRGGQTGRDAGGSHFGGGCESLGATPIRPMAGQTGAGTGAGIGAGAN